MTNHEAPGRNDLATNDLDDRPPRWPGLDRRENGTDGGGHVFQLAAVTRDRATGYTASLTVGIRGFA